MASLEPVIVAKGPSTLMESISWSYLDPQIEFWRQIEGGNGYECWVDIEKMFTTAFKLVYSLSVEP